MQYVMFQNRQPEGVIQCPCGATSEKSTMARHGHSGWLIPCGQFDYEDQSLVGVCQDCHLCNSSEDWKEVQRRRTELWCIQPDADMSLVRWLEKLAHKGYALGDAEEEARHEYERELYMDGDWRHPLM